MAAQESVPRQLQPSRAVDSAAVTRAADLLVRWPARLGGVRLAAVDGPSGSGKTVFSRALAAELNRRGLTVAVVACDDFATWNRPASWWPELEVGVLAALANGSDGRYRAIRWANDNPIPGPFVDIAVPDVLIIEGVTSARRALVGRVSVAVWLEWGSPSQRLDVVASRDGEQCREPLRLWQDFEAGWFAVDGTRERCDVVVCR
ncbi:uridine kinase [Hoyosella sp. YIM 151337]|uniref:uridine kinase family protein n=1 Tax=Hoyosella sp. YIM 151337 TaxID=2992742 RepID=UPI0022363EB8|nr:uridine kinase [Hoyosella sp. YIM 151337]MCW4352676.1 uridine kinase [Hoyosella sp. YIM 151337]